MPQPKQHFVKWGPSSPPPKKGQILPCSAHVYCGQTAGWIKMPRGKEIGLGPGDIMLDGNAALPPEKGHSPQFSAHVYCAQTAGCIMILPGDIVIDGDRPSSPPLKGHSPQFSADVRCGQTAGWIKMPLCTEVDLGPGHTVTDADPAAPPTARIWAEHGGGCAPLGTGSRAPSNTKWPGRGLPACQVSF